MFVKRNYKIGLIDQSNIENQKFSKAKPSQNNKKTMKQKDIIEPFMLKQNMFFENEAQQDITEYKLTKPQKASISSEDKMGSDQKKKRGSSRIQSFMNKVKNETIAINIQFDAAKFNDQAHLEDQNINGEVQLQNLSKSQEKQNNDIEIQQKIQSQKNQEKSQQNYQQLDSLQQNVSTQIPERKLMNFFLSLGDDSDDSENEKENFPITEDSKDLVQKKKFKKINYLTNKFNNSANLKKTSQSLLKSSEPSKIQEKPFIFIDEKTTEQSVQGENKLEQRDAKKKSVLLMNFDDQSEQSQNDQDVETKVEIQASQDIENHSTTNKKFPQPNILLPQKSGRQKNILLCDFGEEQCQDSSQSLSTSNPIILKESIFDSTKSISSNDDQITLTRTISIVQLVRMSPTESYIYEPIPQNCIFQTFVKRYLQPNQNNLVYEMFDHDTYKSILKVRQVSEGFEIFSAKEAMNMVWSGNSRSLPKVNEETSCALLCSNFFGTQFNCFKFNRNNQKPDISKLNRLITIDYETNLFGLNGPRRMQVYIPSIHYLIRGQKNLREAYESQKEQNPKEPSKIEHFVNRKPKWNSAISSFVLNFNGRATVSSVKNFIITRKEGEGKDAAKPSENLVLFGKMEKNVFNLDIKYPFNLVQGLALALSSFDKKIACQ